MLLKLNPSFSPSLSLPLCVCVCLCLCPSPLSISPSLPLTGYASDSGCAAADLTIGVMEGQSTAPFLVVSDNLYRLCRLFLSIPITTDCSNNRHRLRVWPIYRYNVTWLGCMQVARRGFSYFLKTNVHYKSFRLGASSRPIHVKHDA